VRLAGPAGVSHDAGAARRNSRAGSGPASPEEDTIIALHATAPAARLRTRHAADARLERAFRRRAALPLAGLALLALLALLAGCQTTARATRPASSDDVDRNVTLPATLANVWYRGETAPDVAIPYADTGTLLVGSDAILFNGSQQSLTIPTRSIEGVVWRQMSGDRQNEWAVIRWRDGSAEKLVGFTAADRYRFDTSNRELYSAIVLAWENWRR